jgi:hypothetical protein
MRMKRENGLTRQFLMRRSSLGPRPVESCQSAFDRPAQRSKAASQLSTGLHPFKKKLLLQSGRKHCSAFRPLCMRNAEKQGKLILKTFLFRKSLINLLRSY